MGLEESVLEFVVAKRENHLWKRRWTRPISGFKTAGREYYRLVCFGETSEDPPRYFTVWKDYPIEHEIEDFEGEYAELLKMLDSFLDNRCTCAPSNFGTKIQHCRFHKKLYGF
jgi:hypothetical protein